MENNNMESNNVYLNEEKYQKAEKKISLVAVLILIVGLCFGGFLIYNGVAKPNSSNVEALQKKLEEKKTQLENKGIVYNATAEYTDGEEYELKIITDALDPSFDHCAFDEYKNNAITKEYCSKKNSVGKFASQTSIMFGVFICIASCMISSSIFMFAKRRSLLAFSVQQVMPVAKEGIEAMTPIAQKNIETMAPTIGKAAGTVAESVARGIKRGLNDDEESK